MRTLAYALLAGALAACSADPTALAPRRNGETPGSSSGSTNDTGSSGGANSGSGSSSGGAGTSSGSASTPGGPSGLPCDVDAVLATNCRQCHGATPSYGASVSLLTYADVQPLAATIQSRINDDAKPMPPNPYPRLSSGDTSTIAAWIAAGAPQSRDVCTPPAAAGTPVVESLPCTPDTHIAPASKFTMPATPGEQYVCYGYDVTPAAKRHVIALAPRIDNPVIVHHVLLFQADQSVSSTPTACSGGGSTSWRLVAGWAPGGKNDVLPPEAGFPEEGTTHWVMQIHLNNAKGLANESDGSGFDMCTTDQLRPNDADVMASGSTNFTIPPRGTLSQTCAFTFTGITTPLNIFSATPHMHLLGKSLSTAILPGGSGAPVPVVDLPNWDFQTQVAYPASNVINPGDAVQTTCAWNNTGDTAVSFGEDTTNEMCFSFLAYYPKITSGLFTWVVPSALSSCQ